MASSNFLIFDEQGNSMLTDTEYQSAAQRIGGVVPGLAEPEMHNKLYRQVSIMCAAVAKVLVDHNLNALDTNLNTLANNISKLFVFNVLEAYPVGSIYISTASVNPKQIFGGTWEQISGRFLLAAGGGYAAGSTGGEAAHTLNINEMPIHTHGHSITAAGTHTHAATSANAGAHTHTAASSNAGGHSHSATINSAGSHVHTNTVAVAGAHGHTLSIANAGAHTHTRGTMNITGWAQEQYLTDTWDAKQYSNDGAFYWTQSTRNRNSDEGGSGYGCRLNFEAARSWTGETSSAGAHTHTGTITDVPNHTHTVSINSAGNHTHDATLSSVANHNHAITLNSTGEHNHTVSVASIGNHTHTVSINNTGGGQAHNNMPPYLAVYVWKRIA